jgi:hypothetical protein
LCEKTGVMGTLKTAVTPVYVSGYKQSPVLGGEFFARFFGCFSACFLHVFQLRLLP